MNVMKSIAADGKGVMRSRRNRPALVIIAVAFLAIVLFVVWSFWAELDQISRARGQVIPTGRVQVIQSSDGGVISKIEVNEGDHVRRDQLLMTLDSVKRSEEHTSELQSLMRISYAVFCLKKKTTIIIN